MAFANQKSGTTILWDTIRYLLILSSTGTVLYFIGKYSIVLAIIAALPVFVIMLNLIGFLTLPLYIFTPESRTCSKLEKLLDKGDMDSYRKQMNAFKQDYNMDLSDNCISDIQSSYQDAEQSRFYSTEGD
ncbi:MAG: hypothetical protein ABII09_06190 [Planctomycetota bacterium]